MRNEVPNGMRHDFGAWFARLKHDYLFKEDHDRKTAGLYASRSESRTGSAGKQRVRDDAVKQKERRVDALALRADEGRDKLRKAAGRSKYPLIRGCLNGATRRSEPPSLHGESIVCGREPAELKHLSRRRKRKQQ